MKQYVRLLVLVAIFFIAKKALAYEKKINLAPVSKPNFSQSEEMLSKKPSNKIFHNKDNSGKAQSYHLVGVCRAGRGIASTDLNSKPYADCLDPASGISGSSPADRYGSAGRQAGLGILIGK